MADASGPASDDLIDQVAEAPYQHDFYQLARRLECANPGLPRLGLATRPSQEPVRFAQEPDVIFAPSTMAEVRRNTEGRANLSVHFFGLHGPNGPMPLHFTEYVRDRSENERDHTLQAFCDLFHHRMMTLLYRAWSSGKATVSRDRPAGDRYADWAGSVVGVGTESLRDRDTVPDDAKRFHAGRFACGPRNGEGLRVILADDLGLPVKIEEFVGQWVSLPEQYRCRIGQRPESGMLGQNLIVGARVWDCQHRFRIVLGPMGYEDLKSLLPGKPRFLRVRDWVRGYLSRALTWDVQLILRRKEVPPTTLGGESLLGWTTWLSTKPFTHDPDDAVFPSGDP